MNDEDAHEDYYDRKVARADETLRLLLKTAAVVFVSIALWRLLIAAIG